MCLMPLTRSRPSKQRTCCGPSHFLVASTLPMRSRLQTLILSSKACSMAQSIWRFAWTSQSQSRAAIGSYGQPQRMARCTRCHLLAIRCSQRRCRSICMQGQGGCSGLRGTHRTANPLTRPGCTYATACRCAFAAEYVLKADPSASIQRAQCSACDNGRQCAKQARYGLQIACQQLSPL